MLGGVEEADRRLHDRLLRLLLLHDQLDVIGELVRAEDFIRSARLAQVRLDIQKAVGNGHRGVTARSARSKCIHVPDGAVDNERNARDSALLRSR